MICVKLRPVNTSNTQGIFGNVTIGSIVPRLYFSRIYVRIRQFLTTPDNIVASERPTADRCGHSSVTGC